ncbi:MAG: glycosyl hydrolase, partial [Armatimonadetes bacterium]|nr:glycosyl hydrolase [Armatimonadota bacterium]
HRSPWETRAGEALTIEAEVRLTARPEPRSLAPLIDAYGQHRYADYPDRLASDDDLRRSAAEEQQRYRTWGEPSGFDRYGGTTALGWRESATGFYRLYRRQGYWWLLSPEGNPCFYVGMCTAPSLTWETTPVTGREYLFAWLPPREGPLAAARSHNQWGIQDGTQYVAFHTANLVRKYGEGWSERAQQSTAQRLRVWGFSGLGKWSGQEGLPVAPVLQRWGAPNLVRHPDVFDPAVRARWEQSLRGQIGPRQNDPLVLGWSLGNEFDEIITTAEIRDILRLPRDTPARRALLAEAAATCHGGDPAALARAWKLDPERPDYATAEPPAADLEAMRRYYADRYYAFIYQTVKAIDPNHLYLGFWIVPGWWENEHDWRLIAPHCDAIGYDRYSFEFMDERLRRLADETAKPILCGEFSFPSFYEGRRGFGRYGTWAETDAESGERYAAWLRDAARHPRCVGVMWFEYRDQPLTGRGPGRGDHLVIGEHFAFGAVDVGDRPKWELVTRMREANLAVATWRQEAMAGAAPSGR